MGLKYDREWEPVYQAFLQLPLVLVALANPGTDQTQTYKHTKLSCWSLFHRVRCTKSFPNRNNKSVSNKNASNPSDMSMLG